MRSMCLILLVALCGIAHASPHAQVYVTIASAHDDSPDEQDAATRDANRETIRMALLHTIKASPQLTSAEAEARKLGLDARHVDLSIVKLHAESTPTYVEVQVELRIVISDAGGKILSMVSGGAKSQISHHTFGSARYPALRKQILEDAVQGIFGPLRAHLLR